MPEMLEAVPEMRRFVVEDDADYDQPAREPAPKFEEVVLDLPALDLNSDTCIRPVSALKALVEVIPLVASQVIPFGAEGRYALLRLPTDRRKPTLDFLRLVERCRRVRHAVRRHRFADLGEGTKFFEDRLSPALVSDFE